MNGSNNCTTVVSGLLLHGASVRHLNAKDVPKTVKAVVKSCYEEGVLLICVGSTKELKVVQSLYIVVETLLVIKAKSGRD